MEYFGVKLDTLTNEQNNCSCDWKVLESQNLQKRDLFIKSKAVTIFLMSEVERGIFQCEIGHINQSGNRD